MWSTSTPEHTDQPAPETSPTALPQAVQGVGEGLGLPNLSAGTEVKTAEGAYTYEAVFTATGKPVRWCAARGVHYKVRTTGMPAGGMEDLQNSMATLSQVSGIPFTYAGTTDEAPRPTNAGTRSESIDASQNSFVLVAWSDETEDSDLAGAVLGYSGPTVVSRGTDAVLTGGQVVLDREDLGQRPAETSRAVILHELSHLLGLGHDDDPRSLMRERLSSPVITTLSPANRTALRELGSGPCPW